MTDIITERVARAVAEGLFRTDKFLPSWLFYDADGDRIFQEIMEMPEYYLTKCETQIFQTQQSDIRNRFYERGPFQLIELGVGDGSKTEILLRNFVHHKVDFLYHPIDISASVLMQLESRLQSLPGLKYQALQGNYNEALKNIETNGRRKIILFLGSNIGNFTFDDASSFLKSINHLMTKEDLLFMGVDLKKDAALIREAYDDPHGITKRFNLNLLTRLNKELDANFNIDEFIHVPSYNTDTGEAKSYLVSLKDQRVYFAALNKTVSFKKGEAIYTEISLKYDQQMLEKLARKSGLKIMHQYFDHQQYFSDVLLTQVAYQPT